MTDPRVEGPGYRGSDLSAEPAVVPTPGQISTGKVKWFNAAKGYGFITPDDGTDDVFVHYAAIEMEGYASLREGQRVQYLLTESPKGKQAQHVRVIQDPESRSP